MTKHYILQAIDSDGKSVYIDDVPNGKKCGCFCKECGCALVAKQGNVKAHHFAHANGNDSIKCSQTALHLLAKEIVAEEKRIPVVANGAITFVSVEFVEQEKNLGDIRPDLYAEFQGKAIAVEIYVSHAVDEEKINKIKSCGITTFEIDLSKLFFETREEVKQAVYDTANIRVLYDEYLTKNLLANKKHFIDTNGIIKHIENGIVFQCPMNMTLQ